MNARPVLTPTSPQTAGVSIFTVHNRIETPSQGEEKAAVTLPGTAASLVSCSTKTMEPLSPVCSCTHPKDSVRAPLASLTSASAEHRTSGALLARVRVWNHKHHVFLLPFSAPLFPPGPTGAETPSALMGNLGEEGQDSYNSSGLKERLQREGTWGDILTLLGKVGFSCSH